jgi:hypothetical protein
MQLDIGDHISIGAAIGTVLTLLRVAEKFLERMLEARKLTKNGNGKAAIVVVQLDPIVSQQIVETHGAVMKIDDVLSVRDENGAPMCYAPRAILGRIEVSGRKVEEKVDELRAIVKAR